MEHAVATVSGWLIRRPLVPVAFLICLAFAIEFAQRWPEVLPGAHALGETTTNVAYGLIGAILFGWLVVEVPTRQRRKRTYEALYLPFQMLVSTGPGLAYIYHHIAVASGRTVDMWDRSTITALVADFAPDARDLVFGQVRANMLEMGVDSMARALSDIAPSVAYLDDDVAHALSRFPQQKGLTMLQVQRTPTGGVEPHSDEHVSWTMLEHARELYAALIGCGAYDSEIFSALLGEPPAKVPHSVITR